MEKGKSTTYQYFSSPESNLPPSEKFSIGPDL